MLKLNELKTQNVFYIPIISFSFLASEEHMNKLLFF